MSSALIVHQIAGMKPCEDNGVANYDYYRECFGDLDAVLESDSNPEVLVKRLKDSGRVSLRYSCPAAHRHLRHGGFPARAEPFHRGHFRLP